MKTPLISAAEQPQLPEQFAPGHPEAVERADTDQVLGRLPGQARPLHEVKQRPERATTRRHAAI